MEFDIEGCSDAVLVDMGDTYLESLGRIIQMDVTIKNVCPGKRVALAAILTEVDAEGMEYQRGMKAMTIPAHNEPSCRDVLVRCIKFVVPEDTGRLRQLHPGHVQHAELQGALYRAQYRHRLPLLRVCPDAVSRNSRQATALCGGGT